MWLICMHELLSSNYGVDHTPHCRPRAAAQIHHIWRRSLSSNLPPDYDEEQTSFLTLLEARCPAEPGLLKRDTAPFAQECVSMAHRP